MKTSLDKRRSHIISIIYRLFVVVSLAFIMSVPSEFLLSDKHVAAAQKRRVSRRSVRPAKDWYTFISPDKDFTLNFPLEPKREHDEQGQVTLIRTYSLNTQDGMRFSVNFQDVGGDPRSRYNNEFAPDHEEVIAAAARRDGRRLVQIQRLAKNIIEMEYYLTIKETNANINYLERSIIRRGRVYSLGCGSVIEGREVDKHICRKFFNSMRFLR